TQALISLDKYYSFFFILHIGTGVTFQLPLLIVIVGALGVVPISLHRRAWRFVIVGMFLLSMAVTPGDPVSLFVVALPLCVFYAIAVAIVYMIERNREKAAARDAAEA
ncbi:MAG TPA: twin-arginine translocase subunit TatC, partial [Leptospiraceae bacterium]|nr:twin-arginine translocase subunit TatC [Leptospiraceae bacterium]